MSETTQTLRRLLAFSGLVAALILSAFLGFIVLLIALGAGALLMVGLYLRVWWLRRKYGLNVRHPRAHRGEVLEGEYTVHPPDAKDPDHITHE